MSEKTVQAKPVLNGRVEITSIREQAESFAQSRGVDAQILVAFAIKLLASLRWDFIKAVTRGIDQAVEILSSPEHDESVKRKRTRERQRSKEYEQERQVQQLVDSSDPVGRLRSLFHQRKMWADMVKRIDTDIAIVRRDWGDVVPKEIWDEQE